MQYFKNTFKRIPVVSAIDSSLQLASAGFAEEQKKDITKQQWKICFAAFLAPSFTCKWYETLHSPQFKSITENRKRLYIKPFRVYMSVKWGKKQKIKVIEDTYRFIIDKGDCLARLIDPKSKIEIAQFNLNESTIGTLTLGYDERYRKEGELVAQFESEQLGGMIAAAAFSFEEVEKGQWVCRIGCIQGHSKNDDNHSKTAQKMMNGLRPKSLIIFTIQEIARELGCAAVYGAGDSIQAYRKKHAIHLPWRHTISFNYNAVWSESDGLPVSDGWYQLPLKAVQKDMSEIKTHKRAYYRKRYALMDSISQLISGRVKKVAA